MQGITRIPGRKLKPKLRVVSTQTRALPEQEPERSSGSREKLLSKETGLGKWGSMGTREKFDAGELMAEVIEKSEEVRPPDMLDQPCNNY